MTWTTKQVMILAKVVALTAVLVGPGQTRAELLSPADAQGIRELPGQSPVLLTFLSINPSIEDRTVIEFDLRGLSASPTSAELDLDLRNLGPVPGAIDVFTFAGTGTVTPDLFNAGTFLTSFDTDQVGLESVAVDVTSAVQAAVDAGDSFVGFRLSTTTSDRYLLGPPFTPTGPTLDVTTPVPTPSSLTLLGLGTLGLLGYGWRRKRAMATAWQ